MQKLLIIVWCLLLSACAIQRSAFDPVKTPNAIRIVTYNLNWGRDELPLYAPIPTLLAIKKTVGDIVLLQEITRTWRDYIELALNEEYPYRIYHFYPITGGMAVLSKYPLIDKQFILPTIGWHPAWIFDVQTPSGIISIANVHLSPALADFNSVGFLAYGVWTSPAKRRNEIRKIYALLRTGQPIIIAGDFNEGGRGSAIRYLTRSGLNHSSSFLGPYQYTWRWRRGPWRLFGRYDHIFFTSDFSPHKVQVYYGGSSDHFPLSVDLSTKHV